MRQNLQKKKGKVLTKKQHKQDGQRRTTKTTKKHLVSEEKTAEFSLNVNVDVANEIDKPRVIALVFCDFFNQTKEVKLNLLGIFDRIYVEPTIKKSPRFGVFVRTAHTFVDAVEVVIYSPNKQAVAGFAFRVKEDAAIKDQFQMQFIGFIEIDTPEEGLYWFNVAYQGKTIGGAGLKVEFREVTDGEGTRGDA